MASGWQAGGTVLRNNGRNTGATIWATDAAAAQAIDAAGHDTHDETLADSIEECLHIGGYNAMTADLDMNTNDILSAVNIQASGDIVFSERADHASTPAASKGYLWVKSDTPSSLIFTDDAGTDYDLTNITSVGTLTSLTVDNITINGAAITSDTGAISFSNENLTTTGNVTCEDVIVGNAGTISNDVNTGQLNLQAYGGTGARLDLYGSSHGSLAGDVLFRNNTATILQFDKSGERWRIGESTGTAIARLVGTTSYGLYLAGGATVGANAALELSGINSTNPSDFQFINGDNNPVFGYDYSATWVYTHYPLKMKEITAAPADAATWGQWWVKDDAPNNPMFTNDAGTDFHLAKSTGTTGGTGSAGAGNQYIQINVGGTTYKVLHDGTV